MINFKDYIRKKIYIRFALGILFVILIINIAFTIFNSKFINDAKIHLNQSFIANVEHLLIEYDMEIERVEKFIIHYTHTNHVEIAVYDKSNNLVIGSITDKNALSYRLLDYRILIYRDTSILNDINKQYILKINIISVILFIILLIMNHILSKKTSLKISKKLTRMTNNIEEIINGNYNELNENEVIEINKIDKTLKYLNQRLNEINIEKNNLIDEITHEINTPLTVIKMNIEGIKDGLFSIEDNGELLLDELERINKLVEKINDISKREIKEEFNLSKLLTESIDLFIPLFEQSEIKLKTNISQDILYYGSIDYFKQIYTNLLSNIYKYTIGKREVTINLSKHNDKIIIEFINNSEYLSEDKLKQLFKRGFRSSKYIGNSKGIGLGVVKTLVEYHNGKIIALQEGNKINMKIVLKIHK